MKYSSVSNEDFLKLGVIFLIKVKLKIINYCYVFHTLSDRSYNYVIIDEVLIIPNKKSVNEYEFNQDICYFIDLTYFFHIFNHLLSSLLSFLFI